MFGTNLGLGGGIPRGYGLGLVPRSNPVTACGGRQPWVGTRERIGMGVGSRPWPWEGGCGGSCTILGRRGCGLDVVL